MNKGRLRRREVKRLIRWFVAGACVMSAGFAISCSSKPPPESITGIPEEKLTPQVRADYDVFAQRCSKCHSLQRPLNASVDDDEHWVHYVAKMRRQPGSGISERDGEAILRFLHILVEQQRAKNAEKLK
jgi:hypothetical protein